MSVVSFPALPFALLSGRNESVNLRSTLGGQREEQIASLPWGYRRVLKGLTERMTNGFRGEIKRLPGGSDLLKGLAGARPFEDLDDLDNHAALFLNLFLHSGNPKYLHPNQPPFYRGYLQGEDLMGRTDSNIHLRIHGLFPPYDMRVQGIITYFGGYGDTFERVLPLAMEFTSRGFFFLTMDPLDHGLSSRWDPTKPELKGSKVAVRHTSQLIEMAQVLKQDDPRLAGLPIHAIGASAGASNLLGALRLTESGNGIARLFLDSPRLEMGPKYDKFRKWQSKVFESPRRFMFDYPFMPFKKKLFLKGPPERRPTLPTDYCDYVARLHEAGLLLMVNPYAYQDSPRMDQENTEWLSTPAARRIMPHTLLGFCPTDQDTNPKASLESMGRLWEGITYRRTAGHISYSPDQDPGLPGDVAEFFRMGRIPKSHLVFEGTRGLERAFASR